MTLDDLEQGRILSEFRGISQIWEAGCGCAVFYVPANTV